MKCAHIYTPASEGCTYRLYVGTTSHEFDKRVRLRTGKRGKRTSVFNQIEHKSGAFLIYSQGLLAKSDQEYDSTINRICAEKGLTGYRKREAGTVPGRSTQYRSPTGRQMGI
jgi:hypothetical protein